jgi:hypothetical protein
VALPPSKSAFNNSEDKINASKGRGAKKKGEKRTYDRKKLYKQRKNQGIEMAAKMPGE